MVLWVAIGMLLFIILLLTWIIFTPVIFFADTHTSRFFIRQPLTFSAVVVPSSTHWIKFTVFGINIPTGKSGKSQPKTKAAKPVERKSDRKRKPFASYIRLVQRSLQSLKVKKFIVDLDFGDVVVNAQLYPIAIFVSNNDVTRININFEGRVYAHLEGELRLYVIVSAFIKHLFKF